MGDQRLNINKRNEKKILKQYSILFGRWWHKTVDFRGETVSFTNLRLKIQMYNAIPWKQVQYTLFYSFKNYSMNIHIKRFTPKNEFEDMLF